MSIGTRPEVQCHHEMSAQLGIGQTNTYYPFHGGEPLSSLPGHNVRLMTLSVMSTYKACTLRHL
jgi:hypothetical protein